MVGPVHEEGSWTSSGGSKTVGSVSSFTVTYVDFHSCVRHGPLGGYYNSILD